MDNVKVPKSLQECIKYFSDPDVCVEFLAAMRWKNVGGIAVCPYCASQHHSYIKTRRIWKCRDCRKQFSVKAGTIFEDSPIPLEKWMMAVWMIVNCKNGISSWEIHRDLKVTQKTAWFMLHRVRLALRNQDFAKFGSSDGGEVEVDESFVGGKTEFMHRGRAMKLRQARSYYRQPADQKHVYNNKTPVLGLLDREARQVRAKVVPNIKRETLQNEILNSVEHGSAVYSDSAVSYETLRSKYVHSVVNHAVGYVNGRVHTNGLENFWSLLKRGLRGTYVSVEPFHLDRYLDEQVFRYNNRATKDNPLTDSDRFMLALTQVAGKRITYKELTGKEGGTEIV
jgi:transposase-like protein